MPTEVKLTLSYILPPSASPFAAMRTGYFLPLMKKVTKEIAADEKLAKISLFHCCAWKLPRHLP